MPQLVIQCAILHVCASNAPGHVTVRAGVHFSDLPNGVMS